MPVSVRPSALIAATCSAQLSIITTSAWAASSAPYTDTIAPAPITTIRIVSAMSHAPAAKVRRSLGRGRAPQRSQPDADEAGEAVEDADRPRRQSEHHHQDVDQGQQQ